jgi:predicted N-acetyltransferase YhbS
MELTEQLGLPVLLVDVAEAVSTDWAAYRDRVDVVRVLRPDPARWAELRRTGFRPKPNRVTWLAPAPASEQQFLSMMSSKQRREVRGAVRRAQQGGLRPELRQPVDAGFLDTFLRLYCARIADMRHGLPVAQWQREAILADPDRFYAVSWYDGDRLVGSCVAQERPAQDAVWLRFSAVDPRRRAASLARALYLQGALVAGTKGYARVALGTDPNLYGHVAKAGLLQFKAGLGFTPEPSQAATPGDGFDEADLVIGFSALADPALFLAYDDTYDAAYHGAALRPVLATGSDDIDPRRYRVDHATDPERLRLPG